MDEFYLTGEPYQIAKTPGSFVLSGAIDDLLPLGSRIRIRLQTEYASPEQLPATLMHLLTQAGNPHLMTQELMQTLCEHAIGNYRALCIMAGELLAMGLLQERQQLDEQLYFECFAQPKSSNKRK